MIGLAKMAMQLAEKRTGHSPLVDYWHNKAEEPSPHPRGTCGWEECAEYYAIIDRLSRGEKP